MSIVTPPRAGIVLGFAKVDGKDVPVIISDEYLRWFAGLMARVGGIKSIDLDELAALVVSPVIPHPQDPQHATLLGVDEVIARAEDAARQHVQALLAEREPGPDYSADIASLRESLNMSQNPKRIFTDTIFISSGRLTETYVVSPGITGMVELSHLGVNTDDVDCDGASVSLTRSGNTITATRNATGFSARVAFQLKEYFP